MATMLMAGHSLRDDAPVGFQPKFDTALEMTYRIVDGVPQFSYRTAAAPVREQQVLQQALARAAWKPFRTREAFVANLDINITNDCRVFLFADINLPISWSLETDAIVTKENLQDLYYELRYWNGQKAVRRSDFRGDHCKKISFLAKFNTDDSDERSQKFSYFVHIEDAAGLMVEHEIDPDIKNPSV
jgi:hypothetical protein